MKVRGVHRGMIESLLAVVVHIGRKRHKLALNFRLRRRRKPFFLRAIFVATIAVPQAEAFVGGLIEHFETHRIFSTCRTSVVPPVELVQLGNCRAVFPGEGGVVVPQVVRGLDAKHASLRHGVGGGCHGPQ